MVVLPFEVASPQLQLRADRRRRRRNVRKIHPPTNAGRSTQQVAAAPIRRRHPVLPAELGAHAAMMNDCPPRPTQPALTQVNRWPRPTSGKPLMVDI